MAHLWRITGQELARNPSAHPGIRFPARTSNNTTLNAIAQPVARQAARPEKRPSGWTHLKALLPYVANYKA